MAGEGFLTYPLRDSPAPLVPGWSRRRRVGSLSLLPTYGDRAGRGCDLIGTWRTNGSSVLCPPGPVNRARRKPPSTGTSTHDPRNH